MMALSECGAAHLMAWCPCPNQQAQGVAATQRQTSDTLERDAEAALPHPRHGALAEVGFCPCLNLAALLLRFVHCSSLTAPSARAAHVHSRQLVVTLAGCLRRACRLIERAGGLDSYLLNTPEVMLNSDLGSDLKFRIEQVKKEQAYQQAKGDLKAAQEERRREVMRLLGEAPLPGLQALSRQSLAAAEALSSSTAAPEAAAGTPPPS